jgi:hypothetical protein
LSPSLSVAGAGCEADDATGRTGVTGMVKEALEIGATLIGFSVVPDAGGWNLSPTRLERP